MSPEEHEIEAPSPLYLSGVFQYIEGFHLKGHQIGRKVGDMLELLTLDKVKAVPELAARLKEEAKLEGYTGATHNVEFAFLDPQNQPFGFIECKKVGVEVTTHAMTKNGPLVRGEGETIHLRMNPRWLDGEVNFEITVKSVEETVSVVELTIVGQDNTQEDNTQEDDTQEDDTQEEDTQEEDTQEEDTQESEVREGLTIKAGLTVSGAPFLLGTENDLIDIDENIRNCLIVQLKDIVNGKTRWMVNNCLTGPQTIEKAKQAALVAMDVRRAVAGKWGKEELTAEENSFVSVLVIGEVSHWEPKSRNVVRCCIDHNIVVTDEVLIALFEGFVDEYEDNFLTMISKKKFSQVPKVREIVHSVVLNRGGAVFYDLDQNIWVDFAYDNGRLKVIPHERTA